MDLVLDTIDNIHIARVTDRLDQNTSDEFRIALEQIAQQCPGPIVLDLEGVGFICSSCLGALVSFRQALGQDHPLVISGLSIPIHKMFKVASFDSLFQIVDTAEDGTSMFQAS